MAEYANQISPTPRTSYLTQDHLGSPRIITDGGGAVISRHDYLAFGQDVSETLGAIGGRQAAHGYGAPDEVRQGYTGYQEDTESGLDFAQARYYNSSHGRFTSVDPLTASASIRDPQTFNRYSYVLNSPYKFTDPLGLLPLGGSACGEWCQGSGPYLDGSDFRGRDASLDWMREYYGDVVGYTIGGTASAHESIHTFQTDNRPYIGNMLNKEDDAGWESLDMDKSRDDVRRFGAGHDGEHHLSKSAEADVGAIAGLTGTILTQFSQGEGGLNTVLILIDRTNIVLILKDLINLSKTVQGAPSSLKFTDAKGNPISKVMIKAGELIGQTSSWGKNNGTFHFAFIKYEFVQQWRRELRAAVKANHTYTPAADDKAEIREGVRYFKGQPQGRMSPLSWWVTPCGSSSPARCK